MTRLIFALALLAAPAVARDAPRDPAAQFDAALAAFVLPTAEDLSIGGLMEEDAVEALLPSLEGDWVQALVLFPGRGAFDDARSNRRPDAGAAGR